LGINTKELEFFFDIGDYKSIRTILENETELGDAIIYQIKLERMQANYDNAMKLAFTTLEQLKDKPLLEAQINIELSHCYWYLGKFFEIAQYLDKVLLCYEQIQIKDEVATEVLANYYHLKAISSIGEVSHQKVIELFSKSAELKIQLNKKRELALSYNNIGYTYFIADNTQKSMKFLEKSYQINKEINNPESQCLNLLNLIQVTVEDENINQAKHYLNLLEEHFNLNPDNKRINTYYRYGKAFILSKSTNIRNKLKAEDIFNDIIQSEFVISSLFVKSIFNLCYLYIYQLKYNFSEEIYRKVKLLIDKLIKFGQETKTPVNIAKANLLGAKLNILENNISQAKKIILELMQESPNYRDKIVENIISVELEEVLNYEKLIGKITTKSLQENVKEDLLLSNLLDNLIQNKLSKKEEINEQPVAIFILDEKGKLVFTKVLDLNANIKPEMISNFISAINSFSNETFGDSVGYVEKIYHNQFQITAKKNTDLLYCYVHSGQSNRSILRINSFINKFEKIANTYGFDSIIHNEQIDTALSEIFETNAVV